MFRKLSELIGAAVIESAVADGHLDPRGKSAEQWKTDVLRYLRRASKADIIAWNIDHRSTLLEEARRLRKAGQLERALLHYATWTEHMLNSFVASLLRRKKLSDDWVRSVIRDTGLRAKYVFAAIMFDQKPLTQIASAIQIISERRNEFVHYKWLYYEEKASDEQKEAYSSAIVSAEKVVRHLMKLEDRFIHHRLPLELLSRQRTLGK